MAVKFTDDQQTAIKAAGTVLVSAACRLGQDSRSDRKSGKQNMRQGKRY